MAFRTIQPFFQGEQKQAIARAQEIFAGRRFYIDTYGCQMNAHDSEKLAGMLTAMGMAPTTVPEEAAVILVNTCCVREHAENRILGNIGHLAAVKREHPDTILGVCGCMTQQKDAAERLLQKMKHVDLVFGTHNLHELPSLLLAARGGGKIAEVNESTPAIIEGVPVLRNPSVSAFATIMYGCDNFCAYCIVPYVRGRERSREPGDIITEIQSLVKTGVREITLLGQNVNSYGAGGGVNFPALLRRIEAETEGLLRVRFMTSHPKDLSDELIETMAASSIVCNQLHLPVQSGSDEILRRMNRIYDAGQYLRIVEKLRAAMPGIGLTTDIIVGFPGETEKDFQRTLDLVRAVRYHSAFTFKYSKRSGTPAHGMADQIPEAVKKERLSRLNALQKEISAELDRAAVGSREQVLVEAPSRKRAEQVCGRTDSGRMVNLEGTESLIGTIVPVEITKAMANTLVGRLM